MPDRTGALDIAAEQFFPGNAACWAYQANAFATGPLRRRTSARMLASNSFRSCDILKFGNKQTYCFCAVNDIGIGLDHHPPFFTDDVDDFTVEFYAFKTGKKIS